MLRRCWAVNNAALKITLNPYGGMDWVWATARAGLVAVVLCTCSRPPLIHYYYYYNHYHCNYNHNYSLAFTTTMQQSCIAGSGSNGIRQYSGSMSCTAVKQDTLLHKVRCRRLLRPGGTSCFFAHSHVFWGQYSAIARYIEPSYTQSHTHTLTHASALTRTHINICCYIYITCIYNFFSNVFHNVCVMCTTGLCLVCVRGRRLSWFVKQSSQRTIGFSNCI